MDEIKILKRKFASQKNNAKSRSIEWKLTFDEWLTWWGKDIDNRGQGACKLQMQRYGDNGAYELGNIKKGYPRDNSATYSRAHKNRLSEKRKKEHEQFLDALMFAASKEPADEEKEEMEMTDIEKVQNRRHAFPIDKNR